MHIIVIHDTKKQRAWEILGTKQSAQFSIQYQIIYFICHFLLYKIHSWKFFSLIAFLFFILFKASHTYSLHPVFAKIDFVFKQKKREFYLLKLCKCSIKLQFSINYLISFHFNLGNLCHALSIPACLPCFLSIIFSFSLILLIFRSFHLSFTKLNIFAYIPSNLMD